jgi:NifU-like protein involved in Fe-S cluster formation
MSLDALYPKPLLRLAATAHGAARLAQPTATATATNPICGDKITLDLQVKNELIVAVGYEVKACVICQASASAMSAALAGQPQTRIAALRIALKAMLSENGQAPDGFSDFEAVRPYPSRHGCVLLPFNAALDALG